MYKTIRSFVMLFSLVAMLLASVAMPRPLQAKAVKGEDTVVHVEWTATEAELQTLLAQLKGQDVQFTEGSVSSAAAAMPVTASWTSKEMSPEALAAWVQQPSSLSMMAGRCWSVTITGRVWHPIVREWIDFEVTVRICED